MIRYITTNCQNIKNIKKYDTEKKHVLDNKRLNYRTRLWQQASTEYVTD